MGRHRQTVTNIIILFVASILAAASLYFSTFAAAMLQFGGISDLNNPIQTVEAFEKFTYPISKLEYILVFFIVSWFVLFCVSILISAVFTFFRHRNHALVVLLLFIGLEILLYNNISMHSIFNGFKYINFLTLFG